MIAHYLESTGFTPHTSRRLVLSVAAVLLVGIVALEWLHVVDYSLGVLYAVPVSVAATVLGRWQTVAVAVAGAWLRGLFTAPLPAVEFWLRFLMALLAYGGVGVLITEVSRHRRMLLAALARHQAEQDRRQHAERQLRVLVESSPAAIMTLDQHARVIGANRAAHDMLGFAPGTLMHACVAEQLPVLAGALRVACDAAPVRVSTTCWAQRANGTRFPAALWFSTYQEDGARYLAGILVDTSDEVREREHETFRQMAASHRLLAGAVAHEIRNLCSAIGIVAANLPRHADGDHHADFAALGTLVESLMRIAAFGLTAQHQPRAARIDLTRMLAEVQVVIEPDWLDAGGAVEWQTDELLPYVEADEHALLQVFLNLSQNALRAVQQSGTAALRVRAWSENRHAVISFEDAGPGVANPAGLFQPFADDCDGTGLGLYVSRAMMRGFGGDLTFVPVDAGCRFDVAVPFHEAARIRVA